MTTFDSFRRRAGRALALGRTRALGDLLALVAGQIFGRLLGFLAFAYLARTLDPAGYGGLEYIVGLSVFFALLIDGGLGPAAIRESAADPVRARLLAAQVPALRLVYAAIAAPVMLVVAEVSQTDAGAGVLLTTLFAASLLGQAFNQEWRLQSQNRMGGLALAQVARSTAFTLIVILAVRSNADMVWIGVAEIVSVAALVMVQSLMARGESAPLRAAWRFVHLKALAKQGVFFGGANIVWAFHQYAPLFFLANIAGPTETAWFAAAHRTILSAASFSNLYHFNLFPTLARLHAEDRPRYRAVLESSHAVIAFVGAGGCLALTLASEWIVTLIFGQGFAEAAASFAILSWLLLFTTMGGHARMALVTMHRQRFVLVAECAGAVASVAGSLILIPLYGAQGAALAGAGSALAVWLTAHFTARRAPDTYAAPLVPVFAAMGLAALAWAGAQALQLHWALETAAALAAYAIGALIVRPGLGREAMLLLSAKG